MQALPRYRLPKYRRRDSIRQMRAVVALMVGGLAIVVFGTVAARLLLEHGQPSDVPVTVFWAAVAVGVLLEFAGLVRWHRAAYR
jgi:hypothetical protein